MKVIPLTQGKFALVDDEDFDSLVTVKWRYMRDGYAARSIRINGKQKYEAMHRRIIGISRDDARHVDHKDGNKLNNQRSNLRICTDAENHRNALLRSDSTSGFKGVSRSKGRWRACISFEGKQKYLGIFESPEEAHAAYCKAADKYFGEFANSGVRQP